MPTLSAIVAFAFVVAVLAVVLYALVAPFTHGRYDRGSIPHL